jgi:hypothetical protein
VFQRLYVFHLYAQRNHSLSARGPSTRRRNSTGLAELCWGGWPIELGTSQKIRDVSYDTALSPY